jgi:hypothetical protein
MPRHLRAPALLALAALALAKVAFLAPHLVYRSLALDYPFRGGDGGEWLANGLGWAGAPTRMTGRPPVLPWLFALLDRCGALTAFPPLHQLVLPVGVVAWFLLLRRWYPTRVAFLAALVPLASAAATGHGLELMPDTLASTLLALALLLLVEAGERPALYVPAGAALGASALTQPAALLLPLPLAVVLLLRRPADWRRPALWAGAALVVLPCGAWLVISPRLFGSIAEGPQRQLASLAPSLAHLPFYGAALAGLVGLPACLLATFGALRLLARARRDDRAWIVLVAICVLLGVFVLLYPYRMQRLLLYVLLPLTVPLAEGLAGLHKRAAQVAAGLFAVAWAAWPVPAVAAIDSGSMLLPVPGRYVYADGSTVSVRAFSPAEAWSSGPFARVLHGRSLRPPGTPELPSAARLGDGAVVFLHAAADRNRYDPQYQLGNALRRRVQWVGEELYPPGWWGWSNRRFVGAGDRYVFFRLRLPMRQRATLVAFAAGDPAWRALAARPSSAPAPPRTALEQTEQLASRVEAALGPGDGFVAVIANASDERLRLLPFALRTSSLFVLTGDAAEEARAELAHNVGRPLGEAGGATLVDPHLWGWHALAVLIGVRAPGPLAAAPAAARPHSP